MSDRLWDGARVPMTMLGGYLGAGKTTLLNHLLATADQKLTVLVNDVGAIAVDASLLASRTDDTIELTNGCVCCSLTDGFVEALEIVRDRPRPDHVVVELSGVAEPARVAPFAATAGFTPNGVVVLVDVDQVADRHGDPRTADVVERQLGAADLVVRTKLDLASDSEVAAADHLIALHASGVSVVDASHGSVAAELVLGPRTAGTSTVGVVDAGPPHAHAVAHPDVVSRDALELWLADAPDSVVRIKGVTRCGDATTWAVNVVGRRCRVEPSTLDPSGLVVVGAPGSDDAVADFVSRRNAN